MYNKIRKLMKQKGITRYRLAKDIGVHQSTIARWKQKKMKPSLGTVVKLAKYFDVPIEYFL